MATGREEAPKLQNEGKTAAAASGDPGPTSRASSQTFRDAHRRQTVKLLGMADSAIRDVESSISEETKKDKLLDLQGIINSLHMKVDYLQRLDENILTSARQDELINLIIEADDYLHDTRVQILKRENTLKRLSTSESSSATPVTQRGKTTQLPKLQLPTFEGDVLKWITFHDSFKSAVGNDPNLTGVQKFQYLKAQLREEALKSIEGLSMTDANYENALDILIKRYGQNHKIIYAHMSALWDLQAPSREISSMRNFYDTLETHVRGLKALGKSEDSYGDLLVPIIMRKLPGETRTQISRDHEDEWNLSDLRNAILKEVEALEDGSQSDLFMGSETYKSRDIASLQLFMLKGKNPAKNRNVRSAMEVIIPTTVTS
ncbi:uncharacterized protein [Ptychodera flava]|uniref:uncharacterized protein n=1 Tax=Ptychodera flava TaxID=63121 RepID=UPI00396AA450